MYRGAWRGHLQRSTIDFLCSKSRDSPSALSVFVGEVPLCRDDANSFDDPTHGHLYILNKMINRQLRSTDATGSGESAHNDTAICGPGTAGGIYEGATAFGRKVRVGEMKSPVAPVGQHGLEVAVWDRRAGLVRVKTS